MSFRRAMGCALVIVATAGELDLFFRYGDPPRVLAFELVVIVAAHVASRILVRGAWRRGRTIPG